MSEWTKEQKIEEIKEHPQMDRAQGETIKFYRFKVQGLVSVKLVDRTDAETLLDYVAGLLSEIERLQEVERAAIEQSQEVQQNWLSPMEATGLKNEIARLRSLIEELRDKGNELYGIVEASGYAFRTENYGSTHMDNWRSLMEKVKEVMK